MPSAFHTPHIWQHLRFSIFDANLSLKECNSRHLSYDNITIFQIWFSGTRIKIQLWELNRAYKNHNLINFLKFCYYEVVTSGQKILTRDRTGDFSLVKFNATLDCFSGHPMRTLVDSMWENNDVRATGNSGQQRAGKSWRHPLKCPFPWGIWTPSNT